MPKRIPDRWRDYDPCKWIPIRDERIIAFKTPLSKKYDHNSPDDNGILESERFTPTDVVNGLAEKGFQLGLIIDFTFTKRYYDPQEFRDQGILYNKMMCPGHEIPKENDVKRFQYEVHSFLDKDKSGKLVGIHCTHGVNRTGYMICRYLIDFRGYKPEDALQAFHDSRGYPVERENYIKDLKSRTPSHGVDYKPVHDGDCDRRPKRSQNVRDRLGLPPWRQQDSDHQQGYYYNNYGRESNHGDFYFIEPNNRDSRDRYNDFQHHHRSRQPPRMYNNGPGHFDEYNGSPYYSRDNNYNADRPPYNRDEERFSRDDYYSYGAKWDCDNRDYSGGVMRRNDEHYQRKYRYNPYSFKKNNFNPNTRWQKPT